MYRSDFLEDVYTFNDFSYEKDKPLDPEEKATGLSKAVPYLITEFGGHIYPTDKLDSEERLINQMLIHARIQHQSFTDSRFMGAIGWCAFDYNTHYQFGSGDKICHHGVMDIFRLPKLSSLFYEGQKPISRGPFLEAGTIWAFGERNYGGIVPLYVFTNCQKVIVRINGQKDRLLEVPDKEFVGLPNPIFRLDSMDGLWGKEWESGTLIGLVDGKEVVRKEYVASQIPSDLSVISSDSFVDYNDAIRVEVRLVDQVGNVLKYSSDILSICSEGLEVQGPSQVALYGGEYAFYIRASLRGKHRISLSCHGFKKSFLMEVE